MKILQVGAELFHAGRCTYRQMKRQEKIKKTCQSNSHFYQLFIRKVDLKNNISL
jgi:hypothetical protein